jgi:membrane-bound serine protease (ClpP class)
MRSRRAGFACAALLLALGAALPAAAAHINVVTIAGSINPASSDYVQKAIARSEAEDATAIVIELDTPGGLLSSTKDIIQAILNARVPVVVFVAPQGAWAASAGTFITLAGHVAAMAPGTSIGAASPISVHRVDRQASRAQRRVGDEVGARGGGHRPGRGARARSDRPRGR